MTDSQEIAPRLSALDVALTCMQEMSGDQLKNASTRVLHTASSRGQAFLPQEETEKWLKGTHTSRNVDLGRLAASGYQNCSGSDDFGAT